MKRINYAILLAILINTSSYAGTRENVRVRNTSVGFVKNEGQFLDEHRQARKDILFVYHDDAFKLMLRTGGFSYELTSAVPGNYGNFESGYIAPVGQDDEDLSDLPTRTITSRIDINFAGAQTNVNVEGLDRASCYYNYYTQSEPISNVSTFNKGSLRKCLSGC
jgi:hypothetical protein